MVVFLTSARAIGHEQAHNATWVPENKFGRTVPNPMREVGEHIDGKREAVNAAWHIGSHKNASWVPENQFGRNVFQPLVEAPHLMGKRFSTAQLILTGETNNATGVLVGEHG